MIDPVTLSALASSFANGFASALGSEAGKDVYRAVSRGRSYCQCSSQEVIVEVEDRILPKEIIDQLLEERNVRTLALRQAP